MACTDFLTAPTMLYILLGIIAFILVLGIIAWLLTRQTKTLTIPTHYQTGQYGSFTYKELP